MTLNTSHLLSALVGGQREPKVMETNNKTEPMTGGENANIRIRKLTPRECWRLMGFTDEDFDKASAKVSDSQLYKQAGNSIVVDTLCAIFKELL